jgi:hypothetical protein
MGKIGVDPILKSQLKQGGSGEGLIQSQRREIHEFPGLVIQSEKDDFFDEAQHPTIIPFSFGGTRNLLPWPKDGVD